MIYGHKNHEVALTIRNIPISDCAFWNQWKFLFHMIVFQLFKNIFSGTLFLAFSPWGTIPRTPKLSPLSSRLAGLRKWDPVSKQSETTKPSKQLHCGYTADCPSTQLPVDVWADSVNGPLWLLLKQHAGLDSLRCIYKMVQLNHMVVLVLVLEEPLCWFPQWTGISASPLVFHKGSLPVYYHSTLTSICLFSFWGGEMDSQCSFLIYIYIYFPSH